MNTQSEFNDLAWPAIRYALGSTTYVVGSVCAVLVRCAPYIFDHEKTAMIKDIERAIDYNDAGMDCDVECWKRVIEAFKENNAPNPR